MGAHVPADSEHPVVGQLDRFYVFCLKAFREDVFAISHG